ncbi:MAG: GntR family transcriptional regulator [Betaproteobacteria bacterium]
MARIATPRPSARSTPARVAATARRRPLHAALHAREPLHEQVRAQIIRGLAEGEWKPGEGLPNEARLADRFGVSVSTIRAAIGHLVAARVLARKQGKGTFVSLHGERRSIHQFFHVVRNDGVKELPVSELVWLKRGRADDTTADLLTLPRKASESEVFRIRNVLRVGGVPVVLSDITVPCALLPGLTESVLRTGGVTLYAVYQTRFGLNIVRTVEQLRAGPADTAAARVFDLPAGGSVLHIERTAYTFNDVPVEVRRSRVDTRNYFYLHDQAGSHG